MNEIKQSTKYENEFIKRLGNFCTIEKAIKSYQTGSTKNSKIQKDFTKKHRAKLKAYFIAFPEFKDRVDFILKTIKEEKRQPKEVVYNDSYKKEYDKVVYDLRRCGLEQRVIAKYFNITHKTLIEWRKKHESFRDAWKKVHIDDLIKTSNATQRASEFYKTTTVRTEEGMIEVNGESVPINKTITVVTEHPPIMAAVKLKLAQANNSIDSSNKKLIGYVPPEETVSNEQTHIIKHIAPYLTEKDKEKFSMINDSSSSKPKEEEKEQD